MNQIQARIAAKQEIIDKYNLVGRDRTRLLRHLNYQLMEQLTNCADEEARRILLGVSQ